MLAVGHSHRAALMLIAAVALITGCASTSNSNAPVPERIETLLPADVLLLGEQHDAPEHQVLQREAVQALAAKGQLAALALEMAESDRSTAKLSAAASEAQVRTALAWNDKAWPWEAYGPMVMAAVRAGVPVLGANLPRARMKDAMSDVSLDVQLNDKALAAQQAAVRDGHCGLLPEAQIAPMTRIQIARDRAMAHTAAQAAAPGRTVLLVMGSAHANKALGVPQHLPTELRVRSVGLVAGDARRAGFDALWRTPPLPEKDYCASLRAGKPGA